MKNLLKSIVLLVFVHFITFSFAQKRFYVHPYVGFAYYSYENSNPHITGNSTTHNTIGNHEGTIGLLAGYYLTNKIAIECGIRNFQGENRYNHDFESLPSLGGSFLVSPNGYWEVPINLKYDIPVSDKRLIIAPYVGGSFSTHFVKGSPYATFYDTGLDLLNTTDTLVAAAAFRPTKDNFLLAFGVGLEYKLLDNLFFTFFGNFTKGFRDFNRLEVQVFLEDRTESGTITYKGNKFFLSAGLKIPL